MDEWSLQEIKERLERKEDFLLYLYTPLCGTCQVAGKMIAVVAELRPNLNWGKSDLNYAPELAEKWAVESVPCLVRITHNEVKEKIYAFHSVPYLYEKIK